MRAIALAFTLGAVLALAGCTTPGRTSQQEEATEPLFDVVAVKGMGSAPAVAVRHVAGPAVPSGTWQISITKVVDRPAYCTALPHAAIPVGGEILLYRSSLFNDAPACAQGEPAGAPFEKGAAYRIRMIDAETGALLLDTDVKPIEDPSARHGRSQMHVINTQLSAVGGGASTGRLTLKHLSGDTVPGGNWRVSIVLPGHSPSWCTAAAEHDLSSGARFTYSATSAEDACDGGTPNGDRLRSGTVYQIKVVEITTNTILLDREVTA